MYKKQILEIGDKSRTSEVIYKVFGSNDFFSYNGVTYLINFRATYKYLHLIDFVFYQVIIVVSSLSL